ncbi:ExbD/TolR family protein [Capnocytophaga canimorsus]|uniref:Biopolymer transport protein exbD2 n=2 Tax=Capnocytophaga canimorsus TaxID=28188 RepID=F9YR29_CAPCC|nr:biopolymer transporter ExbD [Capnocytophaga canimorsus]AEK23639.1 Biopolymer transport protein exbD2 [Capnocytophaga canimorsus Cc5]ATA76648.1 biopolymer transporter ExbD [Capnocytophaga canimorsus]ATA91261.1 biopolymer transporter ExbD [Capnocytophaga canimorsus]ATA93370.1 biopolymer transporter ExbD [Capnocytophaga canimorsus]AWL78108.1 biopolymer transporter ExbD [Capnocytophaga canimorsus]
MAKRSIPEVNAGSMADIAFLLLIFFLVTTTIETNAGIMTKLPPKIDLKTPPPPVKERNVLEVVVNKNNQLLVDGQLMELKDVRKAAKEFLDNGADGSCAHCQGKKLVESSENPDKAVISLRNDRETSYKTYVAVQNELIAAYNELRERERVRLFPNEVSFMEMDAEYNAARTPKSRKNELEPKIKKLQELFPRKLIEAESKKN